MSVEYKKQSINQFTKQTEYLTTTVADANNDRDGVETIFKRMDAMRNKLPT